jgi:molybdopterin-binding protein
LIKNFIKEVITGMLLSDGSIELAKRSNNARFSIYMANLEFINNFYNIMKSDNLVIANYNKYDWLDKK